MVFEIECPIMIFGTINNMIQNLCVCRHVASLFDPYRVGFFFAAYHGFRPAAFTRGYPYSKPCGLLHPTTKHKLL
jgi:hypothetical protein